jgi:hypothetical protein
LRQHPGHLLARLRGARCRLDHGWTRWLDDVWVVAWLLSFLFAQALQVVSDRLRRKVEFARDRALRKSR